MTTTTDDSRDRPEPPAESGTETTTPRAVLRAVPATFAPGLRHGWALLTHWATAGYMSDDEIRRRIVKRHLDRYEEDREATRTQVRRLGKKTAKISSDLAHYGATHQEATRLRDLTGELRRYHIAQKTLAEMQFERELAQPSAAQIRRVRTLRALVRFGCVILPGAAVGVGLVVAVPWLGLAVLPVVLGGAWWLGRHPVELTPRPLAPDLIRPELAPLDADGESAADDAPFPLDDDTTPERAVEALARALKSERQPVKSITDGRAEPWGFSAYVTYSSGGPDQLNEAATYRSLITMLGLRRNGLLVEGDPDAGASATVRLMQRNPFTPETVGPVPYRPPLSRSILDPAEYGVAMDGAPLTFTLAEVMLLMVADSGGGKSGVHLAMAEVVTACVDAVALNLDPAGTGVGALEGAITLTATMDDARICAVLEFLLALCSARARLRARYGWGNRWRVSAEHPAFITFVDEWPQLSARAKTLLIRLLMIGRKEGVWVIGASQFGTRDHLGDAIGPKLSGKMLGPCRRTDVTELLGGGVLGEGYRPDLLRAATTTDAGDAGQIYAKGLPGLPDRPVRYQVREIMSDRAAELGAERAAAGLPDVSHTLMEAGLLDQWLDLQPVAGHQPAAPSVPPLLETIRAAFRAEGDPDGLTISELLVHLQRADAAYWGQWDDTDDRTRRTKVGAALSRHLADAEVPLRSKRLPRQGKPSGYRLVDVKSAIAEMQK